MAKTITELEASDIDLEGNELHKVLEVGLLVGLMTVAMGKDKSTEGVKQSTRQAVASLLNALERSGFSVSKRETVPAVFNDFFGGPLNG